MAKKWTITIDDHPYVKDGDYTFDNITKLETFYGSNDIQRYQVTEITKVDTMEHTKKSYLISEVIPVSAVRLVLEAKKAHDKYCGDCPGRCL